MWYLLYRIQYLYPKMVFRNLLSPTEVKDIRIPHQLLLKNLDAIMQLVFPLSSSVSSIVMEPMVEVRFKIFYLQMLDVDTQNHLLLIYKVAADMEQRHMQKLLQELLVLSQLLMVVQDTTSKTTKGHIQRSRWNRNWYWIHCLDSNRYRKSWSRSVTTSSSQMLVQDIHNHLLSQLIIHSHIQELTPLELEQEHIIEMKQ